MKIRFAFSVLAAIALLLMTGSAAASPNYAPIGTGFTYQGRLMDGGAPADGTYDFQFALYDAESGGNSGGLDRPKDDVTVADGLFTVQLDFGSIFDGTALWLEIGVRPGSSTGAYTTLSPRQPLTPTPYALYACQAPWSGLSGVRPIRTEVARGLGLTLSGNQFSVDTGVIQKRVTGSVFHAAMPSARSAADGSVTCEPRQQAAPAR